MPTVNILRRLSLSRLLLLCAVVVAVGIGATALALAIGTGPTPPPKPLADAVHDALTAAPVPGVSARIQFTDQLFEGANLASDGGEGGKLASSPLLSGASGRLWIAANGRVRLELQSSNGDTQILYEPNSRTVSLYDAAAATLYRYQLPADSTQSSSAGSGAGGAGSSGSQPDRVPTVAEIQEAIEHVMRHATLSGATPTDVAGQAAYSVRISPSHNGGLVGGAELAWDAVHGVPLRLALYSTESSSPVIELTATEVSYGPVEESVFAITPPAGTKVTEVSAPEGSGESYGHDHGGSGPAGQAPVSGASAVQAALPFTLDAPSTLAGMSLGGVQLVHLDGKPAALVTYGEGLGGIAVLESEVKAGGNSTEGSSQSLPSGLPRVALPGASATELPTPLGTLLQFERAGVSYVLGGSVTPATAEAAAKGL